MKKVIATAVLAGCATMAGAGIATAADDSMEYITVDSATVNTSVNHRDGTTTNITTSKDNSAYKLESGDNSVIVDTDKNEIIVDDYVASYSKDDKVVAVGDNIVYIGNLVSDIDNGNIGDLEDYVVGEGSGGTFEDVIDETDETGDDATNDDTITYPEYDEDIINGEDSDEDSDVTYQEVQDAVNEAFMNMMEYNGIDRETTTAAINDVSTGNVTPDTINPIIDQSLAHNNLDREKVRELTKKILDGTVTSEDIEDFTHDVGQGQGVKNAQNDMKETADTANTAVKGGIDSLFGFLFGTNK